MTLSKENYLKILGKSFLQKLDERINFLHGLKIFSKWSKKSLEKLTYFFEQRVVRNNEFIYKQGEEADRVYFIQSGEIELTVASTITKSSYFPKSLKIAVISENDIFGDDEVIKGITRKFSTRCITNTANLLWISKQYFLMRVNKDSLRSLKSTNLIRSNFREKRMKTIEIEKKSESGSTLIKPQVFIRTLCKTTNKLLKDLKFRNTSVRVSGKFIDSIKKKSLLDVSSPTALIIDEVIKDSPKTIRFFYNTKGFQPSNKNPSGAFQSIQKNFKDRTTFGPSFS